MEIFRRSFLTGCASLALASCAPLKALNTVLPKDGGSEEVASNISYGPDPRQKLDVYRPLPSKNPAPVILFFYGGSWNSGSKDDYSFVGRAFASQGFVTVLCDYRLVPVVRFPAFLEDCARAFRWVRKTIETYGGDPDHIHLVGHSAGAYNAVMIALDRHYLADLDESHRTIRSVSGLSGPYDFLPLDVDVSIATFSNAPDLRQTQPINFVRATAPPMFLATGDVDTTVYPKNTHALASKLRNVGAPVVEKTYAGLSHVDTLLSLSTFFRGKAPILRDIVSFIAAVDRAVSSPISSSK